MAKMKSLTKILNKSGPKTVPRGTPDTISCHSLNLERSLTRFFSFMILEDLRDFIFNNKNRIFVFVAPHNMT